MHFNAQHIGLFFFGMHCISLGVLIYWSGYLPKFIGVLLPIAGIVYIANSLAHIIAPAFAERLPPAVFLPGFLAEFSLCVWLLVRGIDPSGWLKREAATG